MNSTSESGNSGQRRNNRNRNRNRNRNKNPNAQSAPVKSAGPQKQGEPQAGAPKRRRRTRRPGGPNRGAGGAGSEQNKVISKYLNLLEQHLHARRKYFAMYHRADDRQLQKLENNYYGSMEKIREFEATLSESDKETFKKHFDNLKNDTTYSENHDISRLGELEIRSSDQIEDPHYLAAQESANYADDTEESVGTFDDYKAYKGI